MDISSNVIRVRVDLSEIDVRFINQVYISVDKTVLHTIKDFKNILYSKFKLPSERNINLYLQRCLLLEDEIIQILRDEDDIRIIYEDLPSMLREQRYSFENSLPDCLRINSKRNLKNEMLEFYPPNAKKMKTLSPSQLLCSNCTSQISFNNSRATEELVKGPNEEYETQSVVRKSKKHKKRKCSKNLDFSSNSIYDPITTTDGPSAIHCAEHCLKCLTSVPAIENLVKIDNATRKCKTKDQKHAKNINLHKRIKNAAAVLENNITIANASGFLLSERNLKNEGENDANNSLTIPIKKHKAKKMQHSKECESPPEEKDCYTSDIIKSSLENVKNEEASSTNILNSNTLTISRMQRDREKATSTQIPECYSSDQCTLPLENENGQIPIVNGGSQKDASIHIPSEASSVMDLSPTTYKQSNENIARPLSNDLPLQFKGDCSQTLGNNCPKKKRRRRRRKTKHLVSENNGDYSRISHPQTSVYNNVSLDVNVNESLDVGIHGRKHIKFLDSPQRILEVDFSHVKDIMNGIVTGEENYESSAYVSSQSSNGSNIIGTNDESGAMDVQSVSNGNEELKLSYPIDYYATIDTTDNTIVSNANCGTGKPFETCIHETNGLVENSISDVVFHPKTSEKNYTQRNKNNNFVASQSGIVLGGPKSYSGFPPLIGFPSIGNKIAFKLLELNDSYCPEVSDFKEGTIINFDTSTDTLEIDLVEEQVIARKGKFENLHPDEEPIPQIIRKVFVKWSALIEPKLLSSEI